MILSDRDIRAEIASGRIVIDPYTPDAVQPSSVDLHIDRRFRVFRNTRYPFIDVRVDQPDLTELVEIVDDEPFILHPGEFVLGSTLELSNVANLPITLYHGMKIGQISFQRLSSPVEIGYGDERLGSKYRGQRDPTASLYHRDFERGRVLR